MIKVLSHVAVHLAHREGRSIVEPASSQSGPLCQTNRWQSAHNQIIHGSFFFFQIFSIKKFTFKLKLFYNKYTICSPQIVARLTVNW